jgi:hypothetical protein
MDAAIAFEHFCTEGGQDRAATPWTARSGIHNGFGEGFIYAVEQNPRSLVRHPHVASGG